MAQTPKSVSANLIGGTASTIYTVPSATTAVVKTALAQNVVSASSSITIQKVSNGNYYPLTIGQQPNVVNATGGTTIQSINLLSGPVTLAANESLSAYDSSSPAFKYPQNSTVFQSTNSAFQYMYTQWFGNGVYVQLGNDNVSKSVLVRSTDGLNWTEIATGNQLAYVSSCYFVKNIGSTWVAGTSGSNVVMYSTDNALTWTTATVASGANIYAFDANGSTFVVGADNGLYTSTNGSSWTLNSAYSTYLSPNTPNTNAYSPKSINWNVTYWFIANTYGAAYTSDLTNYFGLFSYGGGSYFTGGGPNWSPAYSKYYGMSYNNSTDNIYSSSNGYAWQTTKPGTTVLSTGTGQVSCAGSNTVLIAKGAGGSNYLRSSNGTTWASGADSRGYTGPCYGMANGYFFVASSGTNATAFYLTTDPVNSTGTAGSNSGVENYYYQGAASNGTGWVAVFNNGGGSYYVSYGSSGTNVTSGQVTIQTASSYGTLCGILWWPAINSYVVYSDGGYLWTSATGASWNGPYQPFNSYIINSSFLTMVAIGSNLYATSQANSGNYVLYTTSTAYTITGNMFGAASTNYYYSSANSAYLQYSGPKGAYTSGALSTNGTDIIYFIKHPTYGLNTYVLTPSISQTVFRTPYIGGVLVERVNNQDIVYSGNAASSSYYGQGFIYANDITTSVTSNIPIYLGSRICSNNGGGATYFNVRGLWIYFGGYYYLRSDYTYNIWYGSNLAFFTTTYYSVNGTSIGGSLVLSQNYSGTSNKNISDGTNFITYGCSGTVATYKSTTPLNALASSTISLAIVEVS
jgi:hypothetical protein